MHGDNIARDPSKDTPKPKSGFDLRDDQILDEFMLLS